MKRVISFAMVALLGISLTACGSNASSDSPATPAGSNSTASNAAEQLKIQVVLNTTSSEYWGYVAAGAAAYQKDNPNVLVDVVGPTSETSYDEQTNMIETGLSAGDYDGLVVSPLQATSVATAIAGTKLPVVAVNTPIEAPEIRTFVGTGNESAAAEGGKAAVAAAKTAGWDKLQVIAIAGTQGDPAGQQRLDGFRKGAEAAGAEFLASEIQYADWVADKAVASMEAIMQTHPEGVSVIVCCNDDMAIAAARAAKDIPAFSNTIFCGFDGIRSACESILKGEETMSVGQDAFGMGYTAVESCVKAIRGETLDTFIDMGCEIIDQSNVQQRLDALDGYASK